jgi:hypothetical protein
MQKYKFSYDKENDDLLLFGPKSKSRGSVELGDIIIDFNSKKEFAGIQIMNASNMIKDLTGESLPSVKELLNNLEKCEIEVKPRNNILIIKMYLFSKQKEINPVLTVSNITESSPAIAAV